jgi:hypothetical protein
MANYNIKVAFDLGLNAATSVRGVEPNLGQGNQKREGIATKDSFFAFAGDTLDLTNAYEKFQTYRKLVRLFDFTQSGDYVFLVFTLVNFNGTGNDKNWFLAFHKSWLLDNGEFSRNLLFELEVMFTEDPYNFTFDDVIWYTFDSEVDITTLSAEWLDFPVIEEPRRPTIFNSF